MSESAHVLSKNMGGGPHGLGKYCMEFLSKHIIILSIHFSVVFAGDPDDKTLRRVEIEVLIPKIMRERTKAEKCIPQVAAFHKCCQSTGLSMVLKCRKENDALKECSARWFNDEKYREECTQTYLDRRSEYRRTGITVKQRAAAAVAAKDVQ